MSIITDTITKSGFELHSTGTDILPAVIRQNDTPIGFLMPDLNVTLVEGYIEQRETLQNAINFAIENQGLPNLEQDEYILTQYGKTMLTTEYDYDEQHQVFKVYAINNDGRSIINSYEDKSKATQEFAVYSGLLGEGKTVQINERTESFLDKIKDLGYAVKNAIGDKNRAYEVFDSQDNIIGYISHSNKLTLVTDNAAHRKTITNAYVGTGAKIELPSFFERLKNMLHEIGLALKVTFAPQGQRYAINDKNKEIAAVSDNHKVDYTPLATVEQMKRIDALVTEIERETSTKENVVTQPIKREPAVVKEVATTTPEVKIEPSTTVLTAEDIVAILTSNPDLLKQVQQQLLIVTEAKKVHTELTPAQKAIATEFNGYIDTLQTFEGFNQDKYDALAATITEKFGTLDPVEFAEKLQSGAYEKGSSLSDKIKASGEKAQQVNKPQKADIPQQEVSK